MYVGMGLQGHLQTVEHVTLLNISLLKQQFPVLGNRVVPLLRSIRPRRITLRRHLLVTQNVML